MPATPSHFEVLAGNAHAIVRFDAPTDDAVEYRIYRNDTLIDPALNFAELDGKQFALDWDVDGGQVYRYQLIALNEASEEAGPTPVVTVTIPSVNAPAGYYATLQDVYNAAGKSNVNRYSNIDANGLDLDGDRMQMIMGQIDDLVDQMLGEHGIERPDKTVAGFSLLSMGAGLMIAARAYKGRGDLETSGDAKGRTNAETWHDDGAALVARWATRQQLQNVDSQILIGD